MQYFQGVNSGEGRIFAVYDLINHIQLGNFKKNLSENVSKVFIDLYRVVHTTFIIIYKLNPQINMK